MTYSRYDADAMLDLLIANYPAAFFEIGERRLPLKRTILKDLAEDRTLKGPELVARAVRWYQSHLGYQYAVVNRKPRIDLSGKVVAQITDTEVAEATLTIQDIRKKQKQKHDFSRAAAPDQTHRPRSILIPMPIPDDLVPLFATIDNRLAKAKAVAAEYCDDRELGALLATILRGVADAANLAATTMVSPTGESANPSGNSRGNGNGKLERGT